MTFRINSILDPDGTIYDTDSTVLTYFIEKEDLEVTVKEGDDDEFIFTTIGLLGDRLNFIVNTFQRLDRILPVSFRETSDYQEADIELYFADSNTDWQDDDLGTTYFNDDWVEILWKDSDDKLSTFTSNDKNTIVHEIGHALGIDHPEGDGFNSDWDTADTVMSYNKGDDGQWRTWYSTLDLQALQSIWGVETPLAISESTSTQTPIASSPSLVPPSAPQGTSFAPTLIKGGNKKDKLKGTNGNDEIYAYAGDDKINAKAGDDIIYPGEFNRKKDIVRTGAGYDTVVLDEYGYVVIKDFLSGFDRIDASNLEDVYCWVEGRKAYIGDDDYIYAVLKGVRSPLGLQDGIFS